jgi:hypothetical protein
MNAQFPNHIILDLYSVQDKPLGGVTRKGKRMKSGVGGWQISWAAVMVHTRLKSLKEPADRIQAFIKEYTDTDSIFRRRRENGFKRHTLESGSAVAIHNFLKSGLRSAAQLEFVVTAPLGVI